VDTTTSPKSLVDRYFLTCHNKVMEVTAMNSGSVHVLRHSFEPSEHLAVALENYLQPGVSHPRSLLYATRLVTLNTELHPVHEISIDYDMVNRAFVQRRRDRVMFGRGTPSGENELPKTHVVARRLGNGALRVGLMPQDAAAFSVLLSGFDALPNDLDVAGGQNIRYYLHADLPSRSLLDDAGIAINTRTIASELDVIERARMFYATPSAVERRVIPASVLVPEATRAE
jgi:hypothetical protein